MKTKIDIVPHNVIHSQVSSICVAVFLNKHIAGEQLGKFKCKMQAIKKVRRG